MPSPGTYYVRSKYDPSFVLTLNESKDPGFIMIRPLGIEDRHQQWNLIPQPQSGTFYLQSRWFYDEASPLNNPYLSGSGDNSPMNWSNSEPGKSGLFTTSMDLGGGFLRIICPYYYGQAIAFCDPPPNSRAGLFDRMDPTACWVLEPARRPRLNDLTPFDRAQLAKAILDYLNDGVVSQHPAYTATPSRGILFAAMQYTRDIDQFVYQQTGRIVASWNPGDPIPPEFMTVKPRDDRSARPPLVNATPGLPMPAPLKQPALTRLNVEDAFGDVVEGWDQPARAAVGGTLADPSQASAAPIFWCWYALISDLIADQYDSFINRPDLDAPSAKIFCGNNNDGRTQLFVNGANGKLSTLAERTASGVKQWSGWTTIAAPCADAAVDCNADGRLQVCGFGPTSGVLVTAAQAAQGYPTWSDTSSLGGWVTGFGMSHKKDGSLELFATNGAQLFNNAQAGAGGPFGTWGMVWNGGSAKPSMAVSIVGDGTVVALYIGPDTSVCDLTQFADGTCSDAYPISGPSMDKVATILNDNRRLYGFAIQPGGGTLLGSLNSPANVWGTWTSLGNDVVEMSAVRNLDGRIEIFMLDSVGRVTHRWQEEPNSDVWVGPEDVGGSGEITHIGAGLDSVGRVQVFATLPGDDGEQILRAAATRPNQPTSISAFSVFY